MKFGICNISIVPIREEKSQKSEMTSQLLYGETFEILEFSENWSYIKMNFDDYKGLKITNMLKLRMKDSN